jgi:hypothetical protein
MISRAAAEYEKQRLRWLAMRQLHAIARNWRHCRKHSCRRRGRCFHLFACRAAASNGIIGIHRGTNRGAGACSRPFRATQQ